MKLMVTIDEKQEFSKRLNKVLDRAGVPPKGKNRQEIVAKMFGVTQKGARKWLEGEAIPKSDKIPKFIATFKAQNVTGEWLFHGNADYAPSWLNYEGPENNKPNGKDIQEKSNILSIIETFGKVPLISWVRAGGWCEAIDNYAVGDAEDWLPCPVAHGTRTYALRVRGDSMTAPYPGQRSYPEGTLIYVDADRQVTNGCRVIAKLPNSNEATFKEYREEDGKRYLKPLNPQYPTQEITQETHICGVVIGQFMAE